jgi:Protein of unknown function (DUF1360)
MSGLSLIVVLSLACYRVTRFVIRDTLWEHWRVKLGDRILGTSPKLWRDKLYDLLHCPYCLSVWVAAATVAAADGFVSVPLPLFSWLAVAAGSLVVWRVVEPDIDDE